jgi:hypothetical protein
MTAFGAKPQSRDNPTVLRKPSAPPGIDFTEIAPHGESLGDQGNRSSVALERIG